MHSLRSRLIALWLMSLVACGAVGVLLVQLYRQSTAAQVGRAEAVVAHACDLIHDRYRFYTVGWQGPVLSLGDDSATVQTVAVLAQSVSGSACRTEPDAISTLHRNDRPPVEPTKLPG